MVEDTNIETSQNQDTGNVQTPVEPTQEPNQENPEMDGYLDDIFGKDNIDRVASSEDANANTVTQENENNEQIPTTENNESIVTLKDGDFSRDIDINKDEDWNYLVQHANKGLNYERKLSDFNQRMNELVAKENQVKDIAQQIAFNVMYLQNKGELNQDAFMKKPFELFRGQGKDDNEDLILYNRHIAEVDNNLRQLNNYADNYLKTSVKYDQMINTFKSNHKDITNMNEWMEENVMPYHRPIQTMGMIPYPEDTLEMIYFWKNRQQILTELEKSIRRKVAKQTPKTPSNISGVKNNTSKNVLDQAIDSVFNDNRKLVS
jgi:hypothetical protein